MPPRPLSQDLDGVMEQPVEKWRNCLLQCEVTVCHGVMQQSGRLFENCDLEVISQLVNNR